ncbi:MAG: hypothetical protein AB9860_05620 [Methanomassiliicoccales archaeon]
MLKLTSMMSVVLVAALMLSGISLTTEAAEADPMDRIRLEMGTTTEYGGGSYVAVNMTEGTSLAWFAVVYGNENDPSPITIVGANIRYLGGAKVVSQDGTVLLDQVPIPVITVFGQSLFALLEFDDVGYRTGFGLDYGAGNGLFDFNSDRRLFDDPNGRFEPVYKYISMERAWQLSDIETTIDAANQSKHFDFSIYAEDVLYTSVWDSDLMSYRNGTVEDGVVERIEFAFHVTATATESEVQIPFYEVTVGEDDGNGVIRDSEQIASRNFTGVTTDTQFKYDHIIEGWDPAAEADDPRIMLENGIIHAVFIPEVVEDWYSAQFVQDEVEDGSGVAEFETENGTVELRDTSEAPSKATVVTRDEISFRDNWQRTGALTWVSNVSVDGNEDLVIYQVHAGSRHMLPENVPDGHVRSIVLLGGYIYPVGESIMHDPAVDFAAVAVDMDPSIPILVTVIIAIAAFVCIVLVGVVVALLYVQRKKRGRMQVPPPYR